MFPAKFEYFRANNVQEALSLLQSHEGAKLLAGGHSLIPMMKLRLAQPQVLIDIGRIPEISGIAEEGNTIRIGALTTHAELVSSDLLKRRCPILAEAAAQIADPQVRNRGTVGGNLAHADPASDLPAVMVAIGATIHIAGPNGKRQVAAPDFFVDLLTSDLQPDEIVTAVEVAPFSGDTGSCYLKFENPASGYAVCGAAAVVRTNSSGKCEAASLCFNGITATPYSADIESALKDKALDDAAIDQAVNEAVRPEDPLSDLYASGNYRVELARVYGKRSLKAARDSARK